MDLGDSPRFIFKILPGGKAVTGMKTNEAYLEWCQEAKQLLG